MKQRTTLGCLAALFFLGCLLPASAICAVGNVGAYYLLRKPVAFRDPTQINAEMDRIESEVRDLREVSDPAPVKRTLITPDQLREKMTADFEKNYSHQQAQDDQEAYAAFGVLKSEIRPVFFLPEYLLHVRIGLLRSGGETTVRRHRRGIRPERGIHVRARISAQPAIPAARSHRG